MTSDTGPGMSQDMQLEDLHQQMLERYDELSKRLQQAARYALEHPNEVALETVTELAGRAGVQPSVFVRLSHAFGLSGWSEFQKIFQSAIAQRAPSYGERIRRMREVTKSDSDQLSADIPRQFCEINQSSLLQLSESLDRDAFRKAVSLISKADQLHVIGQRRSHAIAVYLAYAFTRTGKRARLLSGAGGTLSDEVKTLQAGDLLIAVSMHPYSPESVETVEQAQKAGIPIIAVTDGPLSPVARGAAAVLEVRDVDFLGFRSIVAQTCLAQALIIAVAEAADQRGPATRNPRRIRKGSIANPDLG